MGRAAEGEGTGLASCPPRKPGPPNSSGVQPIVEFAGRGHPAGRRERFPGGRGQTCRQECQPGRNVPRGTRGSSALFPAAPWCWQGPGHGALSVTFHLSPAQVTLLTPAQHGGVRGGPRGWVFPGDVRPWPLCSIPKEGQPWAHRRQLPPPRGRAAYPGILRCRQDHTRLCFSFWAALWCVRS